VDGLYTNPLIPLIFGSEEFVEDPETGGFNMFLKTLCCDGETPETAFILPHLVNPLTINLTCCDDYIVSRVIEPGMDAAQIMALGLEMVAECILHLDCPGDELTFPIMLTCCEG
jgi:hypothetical protein